MNRVAFFQGLFNSIADSGRDLVGWPRGGEEDDPAEVCIALSHRLIGQAGEASAAALAQRLVEGCRRLDAEERKRFFARIAQNFSPDPGLTLAAATAYRDDPNPATLARLRAAAESPRQEVFRRMNMAPGGTAALVALRVHLLDLLPENPGLRAVDDDLLHLLSSWFNRGFLQFTRVDWRSPAILLEKLITYEAVHPFKGWDDLRRRLGPDRRCFAFFHPALPDEPLIFVQVALVKGMADKIAPLIDLARPNDDPALADTAIFYSISNCQKGLRGVSFGSFLIKQVATELRHEWPNLQTFATLSPVPGFRRWLDDLPPPDDAEAASILARTKNAFESPDWLKDEAAVKALKTPLSGLCARYLMGAKGRGGYPLDPVARFHLGNGARLERLNWAGDVSAKGMRQSAGLMVNYLYRLDRLEQNHEAYVNDKRVIAARPVATLARQAPLPEEQGETTP